MLRIDHIFLLLYYCVIFRSFAFVFYYPVAFAFLFIDFFSLFFCFVGIYRAIGPWRKHIVLVVYLALKVRLGHFIGCPGPGNQHQTIIQKPVRGGKLTSK